MKGLTRLVVFVILLYVGITYGGPWLKSQFGRTGAGAARGSIGRDTSCIRAVESAAEQFGDNVVRAGKLPLDEDRWSDVLSESQAQAGSARSDCDCYKAPQSEQESCAVAARALDELDEFMRWVDDGLRNGNPPLNLAAHQQAIYNRLNEARGKLR